MSFRMFSDGEVRDSIRERKAREEVNKEVCGQAYVKCKNCKGTGLKYYTWGDTSEDTARWNGEFCDICGGTGYVDWVEAIIRGTGERV
jgi:DnaJ-class molecular chaperone